MEIQVGVKQKCYLISKPRLVRSEGTPMAYMASLEKQSQACSRSSYSCRHCHYYYVCSSYSDWCYYFFNYYSDSHCVQPHNTCKSTYSLSCTFVVVTDDAKLDNTYSKKWKLNLSEKICVQKRPHQQKNKAHNKREIYLLLHARKAHSVSLSALSHD